MTHRRVTIPLFSGHLHVVTSEKSYRRLTRKIPTLPDVIDGAFGQTVHTLYEFDTGGNRQVVVIFVNLAALEPHGPAQILSTIAHECVHAAALILENVYHPHSGNDEALPYLTTWALCEVLDVCERAAGRRMVWKRRKTAS